MNHRSFVVNGPIISSRYRHTKLRQSTGSVWPGVVAALCCIGMLLLVGWYLMHNLQLPESEPPLLSEVIRGPYEYDVLEQGEVESTNNVEVRCDVKSRSGGGTSTTILDVITEGSQVDAGEWLITLDASSLQEERSRQRIVVNTSEAMTIQAEAEFEISNIARTEYLEGTFVQEEKTILNEIYVAEDTLKKMLLELHSAERLLAKGLVTDLQLDAQRFTVAKAQNELDAANTKLKVLRDYTRKKMLTQLDSDIKATRVKWQNEQDSHTEEKSKLEEIEDQIVKCTIKAPQAGVVVYANVNSGRSNEFIVEPGSPVRERQVIIRLPDPNHMQVKAKINEARINLVQPHQPVSIRIDALGDENLRGEVIKVNRYAEPGHWWRSTSKEYATTIRIIDPPAGILSGLTAEVRIHIEQSHEMLQLPMESVYEQNGRVFCLVQNGSKFETAEISVSSANNTTVAIQEPTDERLTPGAKVVANARKNLDLFNLPPEPEDIHPPTENAKKIGAKPTQKNLRAQVN